MRKELIGCIATLVLSVGTVTADVEVVSGPDISRTNSFYISNRAPLLPSQFIGLPVGSVAPGGWVKAFLQRQREGLTGHLGKISAWLQKEDNAWLSKDGKGKYGWEEVPYWLRGYIELAYVFNDPKMIAESRTWIEGTLASQRANGDFGPDQRFEDGTRDYWANMVMLNCLQSYYEHSPREITTGGGAQSDAGSISRGEGDRRVLDLMTRYFKYQSTVPDNQMLTHYWQKMRGGDNLYSIHWLYNRTGDPELLKIGEKIHRCTANWRMPDNLPNWHIVNIAECFREPAQFYLQSHNPTDLQFAYANHREARKRFGQVPGGMFGGDENCRPGFDDPRQASETCSMVEQMFSDALMLQMTGDPFWADHCEEVAFNSYPAAVMPDFSAFRYLTAPNHVVSDSKNHAPGIDNSGPFLMMNPFSSRCCQHNHSFGWPYFNKHLWMATADNGVCAAVYSASEVSVKVGDGTTIRLTEETRYPFEDTLRFKLATDKKVTFPFYLRLPAWCQSPELTVNGKRAKLGPPREITSTGTAQSDAATISRGKSEGKFIRMEREWKNGDTVTLRLPMQVSVRKWERNHNSVSVDYGPLTFSLKIGERYDKHDSIKTAIGDSSWQKGADPSKWPSWEIHPTTPWNYGLVLNEKNPEKSFTVKRHKWPANNFPFTPDAVPISMTVRAKQIPEWQLDRHGLCAVLQDSPVLSDEKMETVTLIPMGAARLRVSSFPVIGKAPKAQPWEAPAKPRPSPYKATASHCYSGDTVEALADGLTPTSSRDETIPRFTWWDHRGTKEWVEYEFDHARKISAVEVYWFDDSGKGQCRIPKSWRLLYRTASEWQPVPDATSQLPLKDDWNGMTFSAVDASALRLEVELQPGFSGGVLEWRVK